MTDTKTEDSVIDYLSRHPERLRVMATEKLKKLADFADLTFEKISEEYNRVFDLVVKTSGGGVSEKAMIKDTLTDVFQSQKRRVKRGQRKYLMCILGVNGPRDNMKKTRNRVIDKIWTKDNFAKRNSEHDAVESFLKAKSVPLSGFDERGEALEFLASEYPVGAYSQYEVLADGSPKGWDGSLEVGKFVESDGYKYFVVPRKQIHTKSGGINFGVGEPIAPWWQMRIFGVVWEDKEDNTSMYFGIIDVSNDKADPASETFISVSQTDVGKVFGFSAPVKRRPPSQENGFILHLVADEDTIMEYMADREVPDLGPDAKIWETCGIYKQVKEIPQWFDEIQALPVNERYDKFFYLHGRVVAISSVDNGTGKTIEVEGEEDIFDLDGIDTDTDIKESSLRFFIRDGDRVDYGKHSVVGVCGSAYEARTSEKEMKTLTYGVHVTHKRAQLEPTSTKHGWAPKGKDIYPPETMRDTGDDPQGVPHNVEDVDMEDVEKELYG